MPTDTPDFQVFPVTMVVNPFGNATKDPASGKSIVGVPLAVVPKYSELQSLKPYFDEYRVKPERRKGTVYLEQESFVQYVNRYKNSDTTVLFVMKQWYARKWTLTCVFNYAPAGADDSMTGFGDFRAVTSVKKEDDIMDICRELNIAPWYGDKKCFV